MEKPWYPKQNYEHERLQGIFRRAEAAVKIEGEKDDIYLPAIPLPTFAERRDKVTLSMKYSTEKRYFLSEVVLGGNGGGEEALFNKP